jgi:hypothetical protein
MAAAYGQRKGIRLRANTVVAQTHGGYKCADGRTTDIAGAHTRWTGAHNFRHALLVPGD